MTAQTFAATLVQARRSLSEARGACRPLDAETHAQMVGMVGAEKMAQIDAEVAVIAETIPALAAEVAALEAQACTRCTGTGDYNAPTSHMRRGRPVCFACGGSGKRKR